MGRFLRGACVQRNHQSFQTLTNRAISCVQHQCDMGGAAGVYPAAFSMSGQWDFHLPRFAIRDRFFFPQWAGPSDSHFGKSQACQKVVAVQGNLGHGQIVQDCHERLRRLLQFGR